ncbi:MAG: hypothetical protein MJZ34_13490 [Paludibacteraceae bacterium]|nr:hypothetical protein [Paludibacteraceae bacterium]
MQTVTPKQIAKERIRKWIQIESIKNDINQEDIARVLMTTQSNISQKTKNGSFKAYEIVLLNQKLGFEISNI